MASESKKPSLFPPVTKDLKDNIRKAVHSLYILELETPKETFDELMRRVEFEVGEDQNSADDFSRKLAADLRDYVSFEDAIWFLNRRLEARGSDHFRSLLNCSLISETGDEPEITRDFNERILQKANLEKDPVKQLLATVLIAMDHHKQNRRQELQSMLLQIEEQLVNKDVNTPPSEMSDVRALFLILAYERIGFLYRKQGDKERFAFYFRKAINLSYRRERDLGLCVQLETHLLRALKVQGKRDDVRIYTESLILKVEQALKSFEQFESMFGIKVLREAFNDLSVACSFHEICGEEVLRLGEEFYTSLVELYGDNHHEVVFLAAQMAYNYESFGKKEESDRFLNLAIDGLEGFVETTKMIMQAKAKTLIHLWKVYQNRNMLDEAEYYCREELRINRKHGISQQYVANALRNLAFISRDQGRGEEGLRYLDECLKLSQEFNPGLTSFHEKVENEIRKFL